MQKRSSGFVLIHTPGAAGINEHGTNQIRTEHFLHLPPVQEKKTSWYLYIRFKITSIDAIET